MNPSAKSGAGAIGLLQLMPHTAERFQSDVTMDQLLSAHTNTAISSRYIAHLKKHFKDKIKDVIAAYNAGEASVDRWRQARKFDDPELYVEFIPYGETRNYVKNVLRNYAVYGYLAKNLPATPTR